MLVAIRKRSWEDHMTHPSGLQYSYDDLDLVCCHGVNREGPWGGSEASKHSRWTRCASMPEGCYQMLTDGLSQALDVTPSVTKSDFHSEHLMLTENTTKEQDTGQEKGTCGSQELLDGDIRSTDHFPLGGNATLEMNDRCSENEILSHANIFSATSESSCASKRINGEGELGTKDSQIHNISNTDNVLKTPHICCGEQQHISISSNNGHPLSERAAGQLGKLPNHPETKELHTDSYCSPTEISEAALNLSFAAALECPTNPPSFEKGTISSYDHSNTNGILAVDVLHSSVCMMERRDVMSQTNKTAEPVLMLLKEDCGKRLSKTWSSFSADSLDELADKETLIENSGWNLPSRVIVEGKEDQHNSTGLLNQAHGYKISFQTLDNLEMNKTDRVQEEDCAQGESSRGTAEARYQSATFDVCTNVSYSEGDSSQTNSVGFAGAYLPKQASQPTADNDERSTSINCYGPIEAHQLENNSSKLDRTPKVCHGKAVDTNVKSPQNNPSSPLNSHMDDKHVVTEQKALNQLQDTYELLLGKLHSNNPLGHHSESPSYAVTDGQSQHHMPGATNTVMYEDTHLDAPVLDGMSETGDKKEETSEKVRIKKECDLQSFPELSQSPPTLDLFASKSGSTVAIGAKPKIGSTFTLPEKEKSEIEAKEACTWLRAAGFPQYAQLYEDAQFPIDISSVTIDHDFLDRDAIEALCRRLNTLNKCALMRLEISPQRKRSEDSDEDEPCAISGRWTFQRDSKRWSRMEELEVFSTLYKDTTQLPFVKDQVNQKSKLALCEGNSSESVLTDLSEQPEVGSIHSSGSGGRGEEKSHDATLHLSNEVIPAGATRASSVASMCSSSGTGGSGCANEDSLSDGLPPSPLESIGQFTFDVKIGIGGLGGNLDQVGGTGKSTRSRAKSFLKRMESLRLRSSKSSKRKKKGSASGGKLEISGPVIKEGLDDEKLQVLNCVDISSINLNQALNHHHIPTQTMTLNRNRSVLYSTQTSNGSTGSSHSEASSGSAVSTPSPVTRARSHSTAAGLGKRGGMYLEGFDPFSILHHTSHRTTISKSGPSVPHQASKGMTADEQNHKNNHSVQDNGGRIEGEEKDGMIFFYLPQGHKPGTFPTALQDGGSCNNNGNDNGNSVILRGQRNTRHRHISSGSVDSRLSFYDNVPYAEREEAVDEEDGDKQKLEEMLQHVRGLQHFVNVWSEAVAGEEEEEEEDEEEEGDSDSALDSASPCPSSPLQNQLEETENGSDQDSTGNPLGEGEEGMRERRDSGVGASLTRTSRPQKLRWQSFQNSHRPSLASAQLQISCQSVLQMNLLQKLSLLQLTGLLESHTPTNKHGFSWAVPKFMKRIKVRDYKDRNVFGVPLQVIVQRTGQPLPQGIQQAMRYLRNQCLDQVGLFRKSGVKSRIQALRQMNEASGADGGGISYEGQSAYDVADMLKQYFRDLPEPLLTSKLSETFLQIYQYMPKELRLQATRATVLLLPDENREALQTLLCLLSDVTASVTENQMTPTNLAVCLAPSVFHLNTLRRKESSSPRVINRKQTLGKPDQRDLNENLAATHGLAHMIQECRKLFRIPEEMNRCRNSYVEQALLPKRLEELTSEEVGQRGFRSFLQDSLDSLLKEAKDKFKGYDSLSTPEHAELAYRKVHDGFPLRLWKVTVEVPASPGEILTRVLREQGHWDEDLCESRVLETLDDRTDVYHYVRNTMAPHPTIDHLVLRTWVTDLPKGACGLVCTSVDIAGVPVVGVRANVLTSRYFIESCGANKSRLTHLSRVDCRGRFPEWYNKLYGHLCAAEVARIRDSFTLPVDK